MCLLTACPVYQQVPVSVCDQPEFTSNVICLHAQFYQLSVSELTRQGETTGSVSRSCLRIHRDVILS